MSQSHPVSRHGGRNIFGFQIEERGGQGIDGNRINRSDQSIQAPYIFDRSTLRPVVGQNPGGINNRQLGADNGGKIGQILAQIVMQRPSPSTYDSH